MGKISEATLRTTLKGTENIPITDTDLPKGRTTAANLKTFVTPDLSGYATIDDIPSVDGFITKTDADGYYQAKGNYLTTVPAEYITETELTSKGYATQASVNAKQDALVSGTNIKTINSQSLLGQGNIEITVEGGGITDAPSDGKMYGRKNAQWSEVVIPDTSDILTKTEAASTYQPKGEYLTSIPDEYVTDTELSGKGYLTEIPSEYVTDEELNGKGYATTSQLDAKLNTETYNSDKATFATKEELSSKANTSDLSNYLQTSVAESTYAKKSEIPEEYTLPIATAEALGGIKVGAGLSINPGTGVLNVTGGATADSVDWANVTSKPETFKPEAHQHVTADVTDLQDKLDAKADKTAIADMATQTWVTSQGYLTSHQDISNLATKQEVTEGLAGKQDKGDYALKSELPDISELATKAELASKADASALASKQDTLVSGTNIKTINGETILGSGDIEVEGEPTAIVDHGTSDTTFELTPNILHKWDEVASLTLTLGAETPNIVNEFMIQFTSGATATQLSLPETVKWLNTPEIAANMVYQISILNNLAVIGGWSNA